MEREFHIWGFTKRLCGVYGGIATGKGHTSLPAASPVTLWHGWRGISKAFPAAMRIAATSEYSGSDGH